MEETESFNLEDKSYIPEDTLSDRSDKGKQVMVNAMPNIEDRVRGKLKPGNGLSIDVASKRKKRLEHLGTMRKGKRNFVVSYQSIKLLILDVNIIISNAPFESCLLDSSSFYLMYRLQSDQKTTNFHCYLQIPDTKVPVDVHLREDLTTVSEFFS